MQGLSIQTEEETPTQPLFPVIDETFKLSLIERAIALDTRYGTMPIEFLRALYYGIFIPLRDGVPTLAL